MKLFCTTRSPYARKVQVMAKEKGIHLEYAFEDLTNKSDELMKANPVGKIPVLQLDDGTSYCDSPVICEYIDSLNDDPILIPRGDQERLALLNTVALADGLMDITVSIFMEKLVHKDNAHPGFIQNRSNSIKDCLQYFQDHLDQMQALSLAPIALASAIGYIDFRLPELSPKEGFPQLQAWYDEFAQRPSMQETIPVDQT